MVISTRVKGKIYKKKPIACGQTVLPDISTRTIRQKLQNETFLGDFKHSEQWCTTIPPNSISLVNAAFYYYYRNFVTVFLNYHYTPRPIYLSAREF